MKKEGVDIKERLKMEEPDIKRKIEKPDIEDIKKRIKELLKEKIDWNEFEEISSGKSTHTQYWVIENKKKEKFFVKNYFLPVGEKINESYASSHDPIRLYSVEKTVNNIFRNNLPKEKIVPPFVLSDDNSLINIFEYVEGENDRTKLIESLKEVSKDSSDENLKKRERIIYEGVTKIALFNALCDAYQKVFPRFIEYSAPIQGPDYLADFLLKIYGYKKEKDEFQLKDEIGGKLNESLEARVRQIMFFKSGIKEEKKLRHGDCRPHHIIGTRFVDLENFGYYPETIDLVKYLTSGGNLALPKDNKNKVNFPMIINIYLLSKDIFSKKPRKRIFSQKEFEKLYNDAQQKRINPQIIDTKNYADFVFSFFSELVLAMIHRDASFKTAPETYKNFVLEGVSGFDLKAFEEEKIKEVKGVFQTLYEISWLFEECSNKDYVKGFFYHLGDLLNRLNIVNIDSYLLEGIKGETISEGFYRALPKEEERGKKKTANNKI